MNRILFERDEIRDGVAAFGGARAEHVMNVLHGEVGQLLKTGEVNGPIGTSEIIAIEEAEKGSATDLRPSSFVLRPSPSALRPSPSALRPSSSSLRPLITVKVTHTEKSLSPWVDLILAPPRPRVMKRLLPQLAALGVGRIFLVGAKKVEKDFWGATLLKEENYRPLLIDGLMQAGTSILPTLETRRNFRRFVTDELDILFPATARLVAHPYEVPSAECEVRSAECFVPCANNERDLITPSTPHSALLTSHSARGTRHEARGTNHPLLAIGPEGGWTDEEVTLLESHGFSRYSLGPRILRTDTATVALLAQLMQKYEGDGNGG